MAHAFKLTLLLRFFSGTASASRVFNEALAKIAVNAQQGGTTDIGKTCDFKSRDKVDVFWGES